jgi:hypothetical protein
MPKKDKAARRKAKKAAAAKTALTTKHNENRALRVFEASKSGEQLVYSSRGKALILSELDERLLNPDGTVKVLPSAAFDDIDHTDLRVWCNRRALYGLPTTELIDWLREFIGDRSAIEICSGNGVFGRALDIPRTDNLLQNRPNIAMMYQLQGQPRITYGSDVEKLEAVQAVRKYDPQVVIGSWVTHWIDPHKAFPLGGGSMYGPKEDRILAHPSVEAYVVIGNIDTHKYKPILQREHQVIQAPWLRGRGRNPENNALYVWGS